MPSAAGMNWSTGSNNTTLLPPSLPSHLQESNMGSIRFQSGLPPGVDDVVKEHQEQEARLKQQQQQQEQQQQLGGGGNAEIGAGGEAELENVPAPERLTAEMLQTINDCMELYLSMGVAHYRLVQLSQQADGGTMSVVERWQKMMEIFFTAQLHIISNLGYAMNEMGLQHYAKHTQDFFDNLSDETQEIHFKTARQEIWRKLVSTSFDFNIRDVPQLTVVEARNHMHLVTSKMCSPDILLLIQKKVGRITHPDDVNQEAIAKHNALQKILVEDVYLGSKVLSDMGFENGGRGYAIFQCAISDFEGDPLIQQYQAAAMKKVWEAAGLDIQQDAKTLANPMS